MTFVRLVLRIVKSIDLCPLTNQRLGDICYTNQMDVL